MLSLLCLVACVPESCRAVALVQLVRELATPIRATIMDHPQAASIQDGGEAEALQQSLNFDRRLMRLWVFAEFCQAAFISTVDSAATSSSSTPREDETTAADPSAVEVELVQPAADDDETESTPGLSDGNDPHSEAGGNSDEAHQDSEMTPQCQQCKRLGTEQNVMLRRCAGCYITQYCSKACQKVAWPQHKGVCKILAGKRTFSDIMSSAMDIMMSSAMDITDIRDDTVANDGDADE